jgi:hypothetical protein
VRNGILNASIIVMIIADVALTGTFVHQRLQMHQKPSIAPIAVVGSDAVRAGVSENPSTPGNVSSEVFVGQTTRPEKWEDAEGPVLNAADLARGIRLNRSISTEYATVSDISTRPTTEQTNDVSAALFLLLRDSDTGGARPFVCPSSNAQKWDYGGGTNTAQNWITWNVTSTGVVVNESYSYHDPHSKKSDAVNSYLPTTNSSSSQP